MKKKEFLKACDIAIEGYSKLLDRPELIRDRNLRIAEKIPIMTPLCPFQLGYKRRKDLKMFQGCTALYNAGYTVYNTVVRLEFYKLLKFYTKHFNSELFKLKNIDILTDAVLRIEDEILGDE